MLWPNRVEADWLYITTPATLATFGNFCLK
jgi:hypothetical protein